MRWVRFQSPDGPRIGELTDGVIAPLSAASLQEVIAEPIERVAHASLPLSDASLLAPLVPGKIIAIGQNYLDHIREQGVEPPGAPVLFPKFPSSVIGPGDEIRWTDGLTQQVDYEAELGVVIGRRATRVTEARALGHVFGYVAANDVTARDLQFGDGQWTRGKGFDRSLPLGPVVVGAEEVRDPQLLSIRCRVNGTVVQQSSTREMVFSVAQLIAYISEAITLEPGDLLLTGTPKGIGYFRDPQTFLSQGDVVEVDVADFGTLSNTVGEPYAPAAATPQLAEERA